MKKMVILLAAVMVFSTMCVNMYDGAGSIETLSELGIMKGMSEGDYGENLYVTRAQAATMIMRAKGFDDAKWYKSEISAYADVPLSHWASGYIYAATSEGIVCGYNGNFMPEDTVTYEQLLKMLVTALKIELPAEAAYPDDYLAMAEKYLDNPSDTAAKGELLTRAQTAALIVKALDIKISDSGETMRTLAERAIGIDTGSEAAAESDSIELSASDIKHSSVGGAGGGSTAAVYRGEDYDIAVMPETDGDYALIPLPETEQTQILPGQLTAGRWNDLENWGDWMSLMSNAEYREMQRKWGISDAKYEIHVKSGDANVWDARVTVYNDSGEIWTGVTDKNGKAIVFGGDAVSVQQQNSINLRVEAYGEEVEINDVTLTENAPVEVQVDSIENPENLLDLMFTIDTTGSMGDELQYIKEELRDVVMRLDTNVRLSCNYYRDEGDEYVVLPFGFSTDIDRVVSQMAQQRAAGGGDYEEAVDLALMDAVFDHDWSESAKARLLFMVLDAPPHYTDEVVNNIKSAVKTAAEKGIRIIPVASSGVDKNTEILMRLIAIATNGTYIFLTDDSGIGNSHIDPSIGSFEVEYLNDLILNVINEYITE